MPEGPVYQRNAFAKVREDKTREAVDGFDGIRVAHPDLVEVARVPFDQALGSRPHQRERQREEVAVTAAQLLDTAVPDGRITEEGLRNNVSVGIQYLSSWLTGTGAAAIFNLKEDAATSPDLRYGNGSGTAPSSMTGQSSTGRWSNELGKWSSRRSEKRWAKRFTRRAVPARR